MTGAAGGLSGGLWAALGAELVPGAAFVLDAVGFDARMRAARAVVTGEGRSTAEPRRQGRLRGRDPRASGRRSVPRDRRYPGTRLFGARILDLADGARGRHARAARGTAGGGRLAGLRHDSLSVRERLVALRLSRGPGASVSVRGPYRCGSGASSASRPRWSPRCPSSWSAISRCMPARTTIRSTLRSWRFAGKRVGGHQPAALAQTVRDVEDRVVLDVRGQREREHGSSCRR